MLSGHMLRVVVANINFVERIGSALARRREAGLSDAATEHCWAGSESARLCKLLGLQVSREGSGVQGQAWSAGPLPDPSEDHRE